MANTAKITPAPLSRPLSHIAREIEADWPRVTEPGTPTEFGNIGEHPARPYVQAMHRLATLRDSVGWDDGRRIVLTFLSNAGQWKGDTARRIKGELKAALADYDAANAPIHTWHAIAEKA